MKIVKCYCDMCMKEKEEVQLIKISAVVREGEETSEHTLEICKGCYTKLSAYVFGKGETSSQSEAVSTEEVKCGRVKKTEENTKSRVEFKHGPLSSDEKLAITTGYKNGESVRALSDKLARSPKIIEKYIKTNILSRETCDIHENESKSSSCEFKDVKKDMSNTISEKAAAKGSKQVDTGKINALAKAGWVPSRIAYEVGLSIYEVKEILANTRKERS